MKNYWSRFLLLGMVLSFASHAGDLRLVTGDGYAPFTGRSLAGGGMLSEVVQAALARAGLTASLSWQPWKRGYLMTMRGEYDATFPYIRAEQRERDFLYSAPLYVSEQHLFSRASHPIELDDLARRGGYRLCLPLGWQAPDAVQTLIENGVLVRHSPPGLQECAQLLLLGRDDLFLADLRLGLRAIQATEMPSTLFHVSDLVAGRQTLHLIVPRSRSGAERLIERFDSGLAALQASGDYQRLLSQHDIQPPLPN